MRKQLDLALAAYRAGRAVVRTWLAKSGPACFQPWTPSPGPSPRTGSGKTGTGAEEGERNGMWGFRFAAPCRVEKFGSETTLAPACFGAKPGTQRLGVRFLTVVCLTILQTLVVGALSAQQATAPPAPVAQPTHPAQQVARGRVFHDKDGDLRMTATDAPLAGIRVSNGSQIVLTGAGGEYELPITDDGAVFVIKPRGFMNPVNEDKLPRFFYLHKPNGSPKLTYSGVAPTGPLPQSIDFPLLEQPEPETFEVILLGDPQPRDTTEVDYIAHDVVRGLIGSGAAFGVTLGDIVFDDLSVFKPLNQTIGLIGVPWYNVIGNHDVNTDVTIRHLINETFESHYGPSYYSFDYGQVHFVVVDNIGWRENPETPGQFRAVGEIGPDQLAFIRNDLALIPPDQFVVLMMHIPLTSTLDTLELFRLIESRPLCISIAAHTHNHTHHFFDQAAGWNGAQPHHHIVNVTVSGNWWSGKRDERGIPHTTMSDGGPNGYSLLHFDGDQYRLDFMATGSEAGQQMRINLPSTVTADKTSSLTFQVNVFNGSARSTVEYRIDGAEPWLPADQVQAIDPHYQELYDDDQRLGLAYGGNRMGKPALSSHLWQATLPAALAEGVHLVEVRTRDMHGREYFGQRSLRVMSAAPEPAPAAPEPAAGTPGDSR